jgi:hypothetical protein
MSKLQDHIESLNSLPLAETIQAIADLTPNLTAVPFHKYGYWVQHADYPGIGNLNDLGRIWLKAGRQCYETHAALEVRLTHQSMDDVFSDIYGASYKFLIEALKDGSVAQPVLDESLGCACCRGEPDATILAGFHDGEALYFEEEEYRALWGMERENGSRFGVSQDGSTENAIGATRKQVEEALARTSVGVQSML